MRCKIARICLALMMVSGVFASIAGPACAGRPWPILLRTYYAAKAGPAAEFELDEEGRTWQGVPGDMIPGTTWLVRAIHFLPAAAILSEESRTRACIVSPRQSPWYRPMFRVLGDNAPILQPAAQLEPPPARGTAQWYASLAREYRFNQRYSEADVVAARAAELGATEDMQAYTVTFRAADGSVPGAGTFRINKGPPPMRAPAAEASPADGVPPPPPGADTAPPPSDAPPADGAPPGEAPPPSD